MNLDCVGPGGPKQTNTQQTNSQQPTHRIGLLPTDRRLHCRSPYIHPCCLRILSYLLEFVICNPHPGSGWSGMEGNRPPCADYLPRKWPYHRQLRPTTAFIPGLASQCTQDFGPTSASVYNTAWLSTVRRCYSYGVERDVFRGSKLLRALPSAHPPPQHLFVTLDITTSNLVLCIS